MEQPPFDPHPVFALLSALEAAANGLASPAVVAAAAVELAVCFEPWLPPLEGRERPGACHIANAVVPSRSQTQDLVWHLGYDVQRVVRGLCGKQEWDKVEALAPLNRALQRTTLLHMVAQFADVAIPQHVLRSLDVSAHDEEGATPLMLACTPSPGAPLTDPSEAVVRSLLARGGNMNAVDKLRRSALHYACLAAPRSPRGRMVGLLLEAGVRPDLRDSFGDAALHIASRRGCVEAVTALTRWPDAAAWINARNDDRATPLICASESTTWDDAAIVEVARLLLRAGCDPSTGPWDSSFGAPKTPFVAACAGAHVGLVRLLAADERVNEAGPEALLACLCRPLMEAPYVYRRPRETISYLLSVPGLVGKVDKGALAAAHDRARATLPAGDAALLRFDQAAAAVTCSDRWLRRSPLLRLRALVAMRRAWAQRLAPVYALQAARDRRQHVHGAGKGSHAV